MTQTTYTKPAWVKTGEQWTPGETYEQYKARGGVVAEEYQPTSVSPTPLQNIETQVKEIQSKIPAISTQIGALSTQDLTGENLIDINKVSPVSAGLKDATNNISGNATTIGKNFEDYQKQIEELQKEVTETRKTLLEKATEFFTGRPSLQEEMKKLYTEYGIPEYFEKLKTIEPEITDLNNKLAQLDITEQQQLLAIESRPGVGMDYISGAQNQIKRNIAIERAGLSAELGAKTAIAEMYQGNIDKARSLISDTVNAMTYDITQQRDDLNFFTSYYSDYVSSLDTKTQKLLDNLQEDLKTEEQNKREDYQTKLNYLTDAAAKGIDLGLTTTDLKNMSLEEVANLYAKKVAALPKTTAEPTSYREWQLAGGEKGTGMSYAEWLTQPGTTETRQTKEVLATYFEDVAGFTSREEALEDLNKRKASIITRVGQDGYNQILAEIDRLFPEIPEETKTETEGFWQRLFSSGKTPVYLKGKTTTPAYFK